MLLPPPEFQPKRRPAAAVEPPSTVVALEALGAELLTGLASSTEPYRLNVARLNLADRYEQLRRATPKRDVSKLTVAYHRLYAELFERKLTLDQVALAKPPKPAPAPPAPAPTEPEPPRKKTYYEVLADLYHSF